MESKILKLFKHLESKVNIKSETFSISDNKEVHLNDEESIGDFNEYNA